VAVRTDKLTLSFHHGIFTQLNLHNFIAGSHGAKRESSALVRAHFLDNSEGWKVLATDSTQVLDASARKNAATSVL